MTRPPSESTGTPRLTWMAAFLCVLCLAAAAVAGTWIAARWGRLPAAAMAVAVALIMLLILVRLLAKQRAVVTGTALRTAEAGQLAAQVTHYQAELAQQAADNQQLQIQLGRCMSELDQREDQLRADASARSAALDKAFGQLIRSQLPLAFTGSALPPVQEDAVGDHELAARCAELLAAVASGAAQLHQQLDEERETARLAVVALARRVQASAHRIQEEATRMAQRHSADPDVLESSMRVDHAAAQQARHAQSMAVLSGEWPGQQWAEPLALADVARAAAGRIVPYQRVSVSGDPDVAAVPRIAEPLIHLVAELLANATQSSPPASQVLVTVRTVQRGAVIEIDDGGVGMDEHRLQEAREIASGRRPATLTSLGEIPQTGLAVVGQYARRHGLSVDLVASPYGGIRAVTLIPAELVQVIDPAGIGPVRDSVPPAAAAASPAPGLPGRVTEPADVAAGLAGSAAAGLAAPAAAAGHASLTGLEPEDQMAAVPVRPQEQEKAAVPVRPEEAQEQMATAPVAAAGPEEQQKAPAPVSAAVAGPEPVPEPAGDRGAVQRDPPPAATAAGLPQRRSRRGEATARADDLRPPAASTLPGTAAPLPTPAEAGAWMGAFLSAGLPAAGAGEDSDHGEQPHQQ